MSYEPEYLPLSWLSQAEYCLRRAALLLNEQAWVENADTAKGRAEHERVHTQRTERRKDQIKLFEYAVFSDALRLSGKCDCVEAVRTETGCRIPATNFPVALYPVEFKHGSVREESSYHIQLCAQAMCLEEMYKTAIPEGAIYFITSHRRSAVAFSAELRQRVKETAQLLHEVRRTLTVPPPSWGSKCKRCSLAGYCLPKTSPTAEEYCLRLAAEASERGAP